MRRASLLVFALIAGSFPVHAQSSKATLIPGTDEMCLATLPNGVSYEVHRRVLRAQRDGQPVYADIQANYMPGSGEFLFIAEIYTAHGYRTTLKDRPKFSCTPNLSTILSTIVLFEDGEWAEFTAFNSRITVFHSTLRFPKIAQAWEFVNRHFDEYQVGFTSSKCCEEIRLQNELGGDFFRPERLRYDARPYFYSSLASVKKVGATWQVEIKGADEPNRATVILSSDFKLLSLAKSSAPN